MTSTQLVEIRGLFPVTNSYIYFSHASAGPLPMTAVQAMAEFGRRRSTEGDVPWSEADVVVEETRKMAADLMVVNPTEVAFTDNTSSGIVLAIGSIDWHSGDNVVLMKDSFPAVTYPFHYLLPDVEKRWVTSSELVQDPDSVSRLVDEHTRCVVLSWVHFLSGARFDIKSIARFCRDRNVFFVVDAIQGLGAVEEDFSQVGADFVVAGAAKWLLGPQGIAVVCINSRTLPRLQPHNLGWLSARWEGFTDVFTMKPPKTDASRYEKGTKNYLGIYGLQESLKLLLGVGMPDVEARVRRLTNLLRSELTKASFEIMTPVKPEQNAGIITCRKPGTKSSALHQKLTQKKMVCALRENWLRISPHFYNTEEEVSRFLEVLVG